MSQLARIRDGEVLALNADTTAKTTIRFTSHSGRWLQSKTGARCALAGQSLTCDGRRGGAYLIAAKVNKDRSVLCAWTSDLRAHAADSAGNVAVPVRICRPLGSSRKPYPPEMSRVSCCRTTRSRRSARTRRRIWTALRVSNPFTGVWCYRGRGAFLNDPYGRERDQYSNYLTSVQYTHRVIYGNYVVPAAKSTGGQARRHGDPQLGNRLASVRGQLSQSARGVGGPPSISVNAAGGPDLGSGRWRGLAGNG